MEIIHVHRSHVVICALQLLIETGELGNPRPGRSDLYTSVGMEYQMADMFFTRHALAKRPPASHSVGVE